MPERPNDRTQIFSIRDERDLEKERDLEVKRVLKNVYDALKEKGYDPVSQISYYILSEDPTYITNYKNARSLIRKVERDDILNALVRSFLDI